MVVLTRLAVTVCGLLVVGGCITDELAVYEDNVLKKDAMKPFLGVYKVQQWPGNMKPERVRVAGKDGKYSFAYATKSKNVEVDFVLSKIPNSKKSLLLLSTPAQKSTNNANMFFVGRVQKEKTLIWAVFANTPVAKGELEFRDGKAKAKDVTKFLEKKGDALVAANKPLITLEKAKP